MRLLDESTYYWVWSAHGPTDTGQYYGRTFKNGMIPCPVPGDIAQEFESFGYEIEAYEEGIWFSHWEKDPDHHFRQRPVFAELNPSESFPPAVLPERLPDDWADFFAKYTAGGKLRKEYRVGLIAEDEDKDLAVGE